MFKHLVILTITAILGGFFYGKYEFEKSMTTSNIYMSYVYLGISAVTSIVCFYELYKVVSMTFENENAK